MRKVVIGSMIHIPAERLLDSAVRELAQELTVNNPEAKNSAFFGGNFKRASIPDKLTFFIMDRKNKIVSIPRNMSHDLFDASEIEYDLTYGDNIGSGVGDLFQLRPDQEKFYEKELKSLIGVNVYNIYNNINTKTPTSDFLLNMECGAGKCHGKGTEILMYDGSIKKVEDIKIGDLLMGDDSTPRTVLSLARGREEMFEVTQKAGLPYTINKSHILSLQLREWGAKTGTKRSKASKKRFGEITNISCAEYLELPKTRKKWLYGYSKPAYYDYRNINIDPYFLGLWLGDGNSRLATLTTDFRDTELISYYYEIAKFYGLDIRIEPNKNKSDNYHIVGKRGAGNPIKKILQQYNLIQNKHIPNDYLINSYDVRMRLLAGIIDTDGSVSKKGYEIIQKRLNLIEDIERLCWSLGFKTSRSTKLIKGREYHRLLIKGNNLCDVPVRLPRKKLAEREINKDASITGISLRSLGEGDYYGFTLDGNHLYQLKDGTVTHNTVMSLFVSNCYKLRTLVGVTTTEIGGQFINTVQDLFPNWTVGFYDSAKPNKIYDITVSTYSMLSNLPAEFFDNFGHFVMDEYHRVGADTYQTILCKARCAFRTVLTATFRRKDGLDKILAHHIGDEKIMPRTSKKATVRACYTGVSIYENDFRNHDKISSVAFKPDGVKSKNPFLDCYVNVCVKDRYRKIAHEGMVVDIQVNDTNTDAIISILSDRDGQKDFKVSEGYTFHKLTTLSASSIDSYIITNEKRNRQAENLIYNRLNAGRKILVLSKRKEQLFKLYYRLKRAGVNVGIVISRKSIEYREFCKKMDIKPNDYAKKVLTTCDVILGIDKLAEEGLDIPRVSSLIYLHGIKDIEQSIGRVTRAMEGKPDPEAFYFVDEINISKNTWAIASKQFKKLEHKIGKNINFDSNNNLIDNG